MTEAILRDELDIRRRHLCDALDDLMEVHLYRRLGERRRDELVDAIERLLKKSDTELLRQFPKTQQEAPQ